MVSAAIRTIHWVPVIQTCVSQDGRRLADYFENLSPGLQRAYDRKAERRAFNEAAALALSVVKALRQWNLDRAHIIGTPVS